MTDPAHELRRFDEADFAPSVREITEPTTGALQRLEAEAAAMEKAFKIAKGLAPTEMVPEHFQMHGKDRQGNEHGEAAIWNLAAAIMYGAELGLSAVQSAQNVFVIKGKPAVYARTMAAQVRRAGYRIEEVEASDRCVTWRAERDGKWATSEWTIERAQQAGYTANAKYQSNPTEMLRAKCIAEVCRIQYQDVLLGMAYSVEELQLDNVTVQRVVKRDAPRGAAALREIAAQANEAEAQSPGVAPVTPSDAVIAAGAEAGHVVAEEAPDGLDTIRKLYKARGITGQGMYDDIAQFLQLGHKLTSLSKLTPEDIGAVLEQLQKAPG